MSSTDFMSFFDPSLLSNNNNNNNILDVFKKLPLEVQALFAVQNHASTISNILPQTPIVPSIPSISFVSPIPTVPTTPSNSSIPLISSFTPVPSNPSLLSIPSIPTTSASLPLPLTQNLHSFSPIPSILQTSSFPNIQAFNIISPVSSIQSTAPAFSSFTAIPQFQSFPKVQSLQSIPPTSSISSTSSSFSSIPSVPQPTSRVPPICVICGGRCRSISGKPICKSCKEFFSRTVRHNRIYRCHQIGRCDVSVTEIRGQRNCQACRLKKCLDYGMDAQGIIDNSKGQFKEPFPMRAPQQERSVNTLTSEEKDQQYAETVRQLKAGPNPEIQFYNIRDATKSFLFEVLIWPKKVAVFQKLVKEEKIKVIHSQWIFILFLTICENGAYLLDLQEDFLTAAKSFNYMNPSADEVFSMKTVLLFMKQNANMEYEKASEFQSSYEELNRITSLSSPARFGDIMLLLTAIVQLPLARIQSMFDGTVLDYLQRYY